jgi:hypothetical protein
MAELKTQGNHCHSLFHLYSILIHASPWGVRVRDPIRQNVTTTDVLAWGFASDQAFGWAYSKKVRCNSVATATGDRFARMAAFLCTLHHFTQASSDWHSILCPITDVWSLLTGTK